MYQQQRLLLATKHGKEKAIAPIFDQMLQLQVDVPDNYDTDLLGTFTGEVERPFAPKETALVKARQAAEQFGYPLALANEGSFGPHPELMFVPSDLEIMVFVDLKRELVVCESLLSTETNYAHSDITSSHELGDFLSQCAFPSHAVIVRSVEDNSFMHKGLYDQQQLEQLVEQGLASYGQLRLETDMRAMHNPTRLKVIAQLAGQMAKRLQQICQRCGSPGFGETEPQGQLPCQWCGSLTPLYRELRLKCCQCDYYVTKPRPDGLEAAEAQYCQQCNP